MDMLFVVAAVIIAALAFFVYRKNRATEKALEASGFVVDASILSTPKLVIDKSAKELAVIRFGGALRFGFEEVMAVEYERPLSSDDHNDKAYVVLKLARAEPAQVKLKARTRKAAKDWQAEIQALLNEAETMDAKRF